MKQGTYTLRQRRRLAKGVWQWRLEGDVSSITAPGQFVNVRVADCFLRRPISVCHWDGEGVTLVFKEVGRGTERMAGMTEGERIDLLCGLGNGFDLSRCGRKPLLLGGGVGTAPLYGLAEALVREGRTPAVVLGFNTGDEVFYEEEFRALGAETIVATLDGSVGVRGLVTDVLPEGRDVFCACGPLPMMKAVCGAFSIPGFLSLEERMGCGFGACMGCSVETGSGSKRVCRDGPVFERGELLW